MEVIHHDLSVAWASGYLAARQASNDEVSPLVVAVTGFHENTPYEDPVIRSTIDKQLERLELDRPPTLGRRPVARLFSVETVAWTLFPQEQWNAFGDRAALYSWYAENLDLIMGMTHWNHRGTYFQRLTAFPARSERTKAPQEALVAASSNGGVNQVESIIRGLIARRARRDQASTRMPRSAFTASVYDPTADLTFRRRGFPCLLQVSFTPSGINNLAVTGFYGTQYLFDRGYGNYLGLCRLGKFVAEAAGYQLVRMTCMATIARASARDYDRPLADFDLAIGSRVELLTKQEIGAQGAT